MKENFDILFLKENNPQFASTLLTYDNEKKHTLNIIRGLDETFAVDGLQLTSRHSRQQQAEKNLKNIDYVVSNNDEDINEVTKKVFNLYKTHLENL